MSNCRPLPTRYITARDVLQFGDQAFLRYYTSEHYLSMVKARFGPGSIENLKQMTSYRLERDLLTGTLQVPLITLPQSAKKSGPCGQPGPVILGDAAVSQAAA